MKFIIPGILTSVIFAFGTCLISVNASTEEMLPNIFFDSQVVKNTYDVLGNGFDNEKYNVHIIQDSGDIYPLENHEEVAGIHVIKKDEKNSLVKLTLIDYNNGYKKQEKMAIIKNDYVKDFQHNIYATDSYLTQTDAYVNANREQDLKQYQSKIQDSKQNDLMNIKHILEKGN